MRMDRGCLVRWDSWPHLAWDFIPHPVDFEERLKLPSAHFAPIRGPAACCWRRLPARGRWCRTCTARPCGGRRTSSSHRRRFRGHRPPRRKWKPSLKYRRQMIPQGTVLVPTFVVFHQSAPALPTFGLLRMGNLRWQESSIRLAERGERGEFLGPTRVSPFGSGWEPQHLRRIG